MAGEDYNLKLVIEAQNKASAELTKVSSQVSGIQSSLGSLKGTLASLGVITGLAKATKGVIDLGDKLEQSEIAFTTMLGSGEKAKDMLQELSDFASKTPFEIDGIRSNAQQLIAMGVSADDIIPTLKALGDVSAGLSIDLERVALNYGQVITQQKLTGVELKDFTRMGVPLLDELAKMYGKTTAEIQSMVSAGKISSNDVVKAFQSMTSEGGKFADLMSKQSSTLSGMWSNLNDSIKQIGETIGKDLTNELKSYVSKASERIENNKQMIITASNNIFSSVLSVIDNIVKAGSNLFKSFETITKSISQLFFGLSEDGQSASITFGQVLMIVLQKITQGIQVVATAFSQLTQLFNTGIKQRGNYIKGVASGIKNISSLKTARGDFNKGFGTAEIANEVEPTIEMLNKLGDERVDIAGEITYQDDELYKSFLNLDTGISDATSSITSSLGTIGNTSTESGEKAGEMSEKMKALISEMEDYASETMDYKKATYEGIVDSMTEAYDRVKELAEEIEDLRKELDELNGNETKDVASAYVGAEEELAKMEDRYYNIQKIVDRLGKTYIESMSYGEEYAGIDRDTLLEYIDLQEQLKSAYKGLSEEEKNSLDEAIKKQKEYNELNDIEKIKADYEEERQALQTQITEKQKLLEAEYQAYYDATQKKIAYEKERLDYMKISYKEQRTMQQELISQMQELIALRESAGLSSGISGRRAGGGVVNNGETYLVGEHGPELFTPAVSGKITPNNQITNNNGIEINISGVSVRSDSDIEAITNEIIRQIKLEKNFGIA